jgi:hypothetical protein
MDDRDALVRLNDRFIGACRTGSWDELRPVLSADFRYVDGVTGEMWEMARYVEDLVTSPNPSLSIDQVVVHVAGDTAGVSARTSNGRGGHGRYLDVYARGTHGWACVQAMVWPLPGGHAPA